MKIFRQHRLTCAVVFTLVAHGFGMLTMAALLLPGVPGGTHLDVAARAAYVAAHPWLWRIGWSGWQLTAFSDLLLALALLVTPWIRKTAAVPTLFFTVLGLLPDQYGQAMWTWPGVHLAQSAMANQSFGSYLAFENHTFRQIAGFGTIGYLAAALGWTWCLAAARAWDRRLTWLSIATWGLFAISTILIFFALPAWVVKVTSAGNAIAFVLLLLWLILAGWKVWQRENYESHEQLN